MAAEATAAVAACSHMAKIKVVAAVDSATAVDSEVDMETRTDIKATTATQVPYTAVILPEINQEAAEATREVGVDTRLLEDREPVLADQSK